MKNTIIMLIVLVLIIGFGVYFLTRGSPQNSDLSTDQNAETDINQPSSNNAPINPIGEPPITEQNKLESVIGKSIENRDITAYYYGTGDNEILFIGGIHGGYSWNTTLVDY